MDCAIKYIEAARRASGAKDDGLGLAQAERRSTRQSSRPGQDSSRDRAEPVFENDHASAHQLRPILEEPTDYSSSRGPDVSGAYRYTRDPYVLAWSAHVPPHAALDGHNAHQGSLSRTSKGSAAQLPASPPSSDSYYSPDSELQSHRGSAAEEEDYVSGSDGRRMAKSMQRVIQDCDRWRRKIARTKQI